jgi:hypothetical protein
MARLKGFGILTLAAVACPCHRLLLLGLLGGTTAGAVLAANFLTAFVLLGAVFVGAVAIGPRALGAGSGRASGAFTHTTSSGTTLGSGTWTATQLLSYQSTGCGVVLGMTIPANFCGGLLGMRVLLTPTGGQAREGILWVQCIIGPNPPNSRDDESEEGVRLDIPGVINFNKVVTGMNVYIRTS